jgi:hypothetical protein
MMTAAALRLRGTSGLAWRHRVRHLFVLETHTL